MFGEFGSESAEIIKPSSISTNTITLNTATLFAHPESTRVTVIKYNQVRFYRTTTATFNSNPANALTGYVDIQADQFYTQYHDTTNSTGFGWYIFYNSTSTTNSSNSNAIPYADFGENSVKKIFDQFYSLLNTKEVSLISSKELFSWLNEGYSRVRSELNLVNQEYNVPTEYPLTITSGTAEYALPSDFGGLQSITDADGYEIKKIGYKDERYADINQSSLYPKYYLRGAYIGFSPVPTADGTYYLYYTSTLTTKLTSLYDNVTLPGDNFYFLVNWLLFRAGMKLRRTQVEITTYRNDFETGVKMMKINSINQSANRDTCGIDQYSNI